MTDCQYIESVSGISFRKKLDGHNTPVHQILKLFQWEKTKSINQKILNFGKKNIPTILIREPS